MALIGFSGIKFFAKIVSVPSTIITPIIFVFCFIGTFALNHNIYDILLMVLCGFIGYFFIKMEFAVPPVILGLILGGIIESNYRRSMALSDGNPLIFFQHPISCVLIIISILSLFYPFILPIVKAKLKNIRMFNGI